MRNLILFLSLLALSACATVKKPLTGLIPGRHVETLQSAVSVSAKSGEHSTSGHGFIIFKQPDRFHLAMLSPFGLTALEVYSSDDRLTCVVPSRETAYSGLMSDLPETSGLRSMGLMKWVVAPAPEPPAASEPREVTTASGDRYYFDDNGLVERKVAPEGYQVTYHDYKNIDGVAFPETIVIANQYGSSVKIVFDEPEINLPVEDAAVIPNLQNLTVLPLAQFKGL